MEEIWRENGFIPKPKLINLIALLVKKKHLMLEDIFVFFYPNDSILEKIQLGKIEAGKEKINKTFKMMMEEMDEN